MIGLGETFLATIVLIKEEQAVKDALSALDRDSVNETIDAAIARLSHEFNKDDARLLLGYAAGLLIYTNAQLCACIILTRQHRGRLLRCTLYPNEQNLKKKDQSFHGTKGPEMYFHSAFTPLNEDL